MVIAAIIAAVGAAISAGSALISMLVKNGRMDEAMALVEKAYAEHGSVDVPTLERVAFETLGPSAYEEIVTSPEARDAQHSALAQMREMVQDSGLTLKDKAQLNDILNTTGQQAAANQSGLQDFFASRGVAGSGAEIGAQISNQQDATNRAHQSGLNLAAQAQQRYFDSIRQNFDMGSSLRNQDWQEQSQRASAADEIARFNAQQKTNEGIYNNNLAQQQYNMHRQEANAQMGNAYNLANLKAGHAAQQSKDIANVGAGIGDGVAAVGGMFGGYGGAAGGAGAAASGAAPAASAYAPVAGNFTTVGGWAAPSVGQNSVEDQYEAYKRKKAEETR